MRFTRFWSVGIVVSAAGVLALWGMPAQASGGGSAAAKKPVTAVVVKSWGACSSSSLVWDSLNANWSSYGTRPISIDYSDPALCGSSFTLADLEANGAKAVILSDPAGNNLQYTPSEVSALETYASEGHTLIGTYLVFGFNGVDNSALAPLFGLVDDDGWTGGDQAVNTTYTRKGKASGLAKTLFRGLPKSWTSTGFNQSQRPGDGIWSKNDLDGAKLGALNSDKAAAITVCACTGYSAIYVASMVEYGGGSSDQQFLYNAIIYPKTR